MVSNFLHIMFKKIFLIPGSWDGVLICLVLVCLILKCLLIVNFTLNGEFISSGGEHNVLEMFWMKIRTKEQIIAYNLLTPGKDHKSYITC